MHVCARIVVADCTFFGLSDPPQKHYLVHVHMKWACSHRFDWITLSNWPIMGGGGIVGDGETQTSEGPHLALSTHTFIFKKQPCFVNVSTFWIYKIDMCFASFQLIFELHWTCNFAYHFRVFSPIFSSRRRNALPLAELFNSTKVQFAVENLNAIANKSKLVCRKLENYGFQNVFSKGVRQSNIESTTRRHPRMWPIGSMKTAMEWNTVARPQR